MGRLRERSAAIAAIGRAPPTPQRRLVAAIVAGLLAFVMVLIALRLFVGPSPGWYVFEAAGAAVAAAVAAATTRMGRSVAYGLIAAFALLLALLAAVVATIAGALG